MSDLGTPSLDRVSVVIPAHDEGAMLERNLRRLLEGDRDGLLDVVVVANGCTDDTVERARAAGARVVEIPTASKTAALNAGDAVATWFPRVYLDADVEIDAAAVLALGALLRPPSAVLVASPRLHVDTARSSLPARQFFRIWELSDYRERGHIGSGVYALSAAGRARFGEFPDVIADDRFVQLRFSAAERGRLDAEFTVPAPRTLRAQMRRATRIQAGNRELIERFPDLVGGAPTARGHGNLLARVARRPRLWLSFPAYAIGYALPRLRGRRAAAAGRPVGWLRDDTSRA